MSENEFITWLRQETYRRKWNHSDLAREAGLSRGTIGNIFRMERAPGQAVLIGIAKAFKMSPDDVFTKAGLFPNINKTGTMEKEVLYLFSLLPDMQKSEVIDYLRFKSSVYENANLNPHSKKP